MGRAHWIEVWWAWTQIKVMVTQPRRIAAVTLARRVASLRGEASRSARPDSVHQNAIIGLQGLILTPGGCR